MEKGNIVYDQPLKFRCKFEINNYDKKFYRIKEDLDSALHEILRNDPRSGFENANERINSTYNFTIKIFKRYFENKNAYITDYEEVEGSFILTFTILIFGAISNYGSIRETIDYFVNDLEHAFSSNLRRFDADYKVRTMVHDQNDHRLEHTQRLPEPNADVLKQLSKNILINRILIGVTLFLILLLFTIEYARQGGESGNNITDDSEIKQLIRDEIRDIRIDEHLRKGTDTVYVK
jgi:hypothetical protein